MDCPHCGGPVMWAELWAGDRLLIQVLRCRWCLREVKPDAD